MSAFEDELRRAGFDVIAPMRVSWYNDYIRQLGLSTDSTKYLEASGEQHASGEAAPFALAPLPDFGRGGDALAYLIGNSRAMWPRFLAWLRRHPDAKDPVDSYSAEVIRGAVPLVAQGASHDIFWASDMSPSRLVDMNRAARVAGSCYFSDELFLSVHPTFGSWVAFRAVVVIDLPATHLGPPPPEVPPLLSDAEAAAAKAAFAAALEASKEVDLSTDGMPLQLALKWAAMRDTVGTGREHKYSPLQSEYHYTKNAEVLVRAMSEEADPSPDD